MVKKLMGKALQHVARAMGVMAVLTFGTVLGVMVIATPDEAESISTAGGWGSEALVATPQAGDRMSPIPLANACGMGASSCFKCHNGQRAAAPTMDSAVAPWHTQHKTTNNSCVGCHQGNPRVMKQEIAHKALLGDPRQDTAKACAGCHSGADLGALNNNYMSLVGGGK